ncbi:DinB/UmuC family translesion DNA polymerase [Staphylococcus saprophyticus]|uniref:Y-family DNA polymerase n=1 Tax=Staphylococcus saprophyticus TaxID=29385 RepID=UPI0034C6BE12
MYDYSMCTERDILCVDLKSFYASVSCILNNLDPLETKLAVVGNTKRQGSVVLAATPPLKKLGIKTGSRLFEIPNRSDIYITNPKMRTYMQISNRISKLALKYVPAEDFHQYSIDEFMMDVTESYELFAASVYELAQIIQNDIYKATGIKSTIGIGSNLLLSKVSMDIEAKHTNNGIAEWRYQDVPTKLWKIKDLTDFWGINIKTAKKLNMRGIFTIKDLALYPHVYLKRDFGVIGTDLHLHANGIDESLIRKPYKTKQSGLGKSQILLRDYKLNELKVILAEQVEDVYYRTRLKGLYPTTIAVNVGYANGGGVRKQFTDKTGFKTTTIIIEKLWDYVKNNADDSALYRTSSVNFTNFKSSSIQQLELFKSEKEVKTEAIDYAMDKVRLKYGSNTVIRASSLTESGTRLSRNNTLAGHKA